MINDTKTYVEVRWRPVQNLNESTWWNEGEVRFLQLPHSPETGWSIIWMNVKTMVIERGGPDWSREVLRFPVVSQMTKVPFSVSDSQILKVEKVKS